MKKIYATLLALVMACSFSFARMFDGTEKIYLKANAVSWWINDNCAQRAVLNSETPVIGEIEDAGRAIYAFTIPAGDFSTIRFERAETAEQPAWNATGDIVIPEEGNYVTAFEQNSAEATWETYSPAAPVVYTTHHINVTNNTGWDAFFVYAWPADAFGAWPGTDQLSLDFQAADGEVELHLIFNNNGPGAGEEGDARQLFDITKARDYNLVVTAEGVTEEGQVDPEIVRTDLYLLNGHALADSEAQMYAYTYGGETDAEAVKMEFVIENGDTVGYKGAINAAATSVIFVRMAPEAEAFSWSEGVWNRTGDNAICENHIMYFAGWSEEQIDGFNTFTVSCEEPEEQAIDTVNAAGKAVKTIRDGQLVIIRDGKTYNALGAEMK